MYTCVVEWPDPTESIGEALLSKYNYAKDSAFFFCRTCGTPVFAQKFKHGRTPDVFYLPVGLLPNLDVDLVEVIWHAWVGDTEDGGASVFMQRLNGEKLIPRYKDRFDQNAGQLPADWPPQSSLEQPASQTDMVSVQCHCKGVDFTMRRGATGFDHCKKQGNLPGWVNPDALKPIAVFDACDSCRFMVGTPIMHWTFALLSQLQFAGSKSEKGFFPANTSDLKAAVQADREGRFGTLTFYESSPDVQRYYCSRCSASVFYAVDDLPGQVDISMGLLRAAEGARAESWVEWEWGGLGHKGDTAGGWREAFGKAIQDGAEQWRLSRNLPKGHRF